jgi:hypothetical protein
VAEAVAAIDGVSEVYSVTGEIDLIAINKVPGVLATETHIAFQAYSRHDLEAAFSLGVDSAD